MISKFTSNRAAFAPNLVQKLRLRFYSVLALLTLVFVAHYFVLQKSIHQLGKDARVINISGRQRMLSQAIARKASLSVLALKSGDVEHANALCDEVENHLSTWKQSHHDLIERSHEAHLCGTNSDDVRTGFDKLKPHLESAVSLAEQTIEALRNAGQQTDNSLEIKIAQLNHSVDLFLPIMDAIVWTYQKESQQRVNYINTEKMVLVIAVCIILGISIIGLLEPSAKLVKNCLARFEAHLDAIDRTQGRIEFALDGTILDVNENYLKIMGFRRSELIGQHHQIVVSEDERGSEEYKEFWEGLRNGTVKAGEFIRYAKDKSVRWVQANYSPIYDADGRTIRKIVKYMADVTDQKEIFAEKTLMREDVKQAIDGSGVGLWNYNPNSGYIWYSQQLKMMLGFPKEEFGQVEPTADWWLSRVHKDDKNEVKSRINSHLDKDIPYDVEFRMKTRHGSYGWYRAVGKATRDESGRPLRMAGSFANITAQKDAEHTLRSTLTELEQATAMANSMVAAAEAANMAKSEFLANMSHEIRTPMTAILGFVDLLENDDEVRNDEQQSKDSIGSIRRNAKHLLELINDILDMSKIEAGRMTVERVSTKPDKLVSDTISLVKSRAEEKGIELKCEFETSLPACIESDPTRLRQILINLVGNAIKFTQSGSVTIKASCDIEKRQMIYKVVDTGIGMTKEQVDVISRFDAFSQADASTTRKFGGSGLGLRISNSFAQLLGGCIEVSSVEGQGSTFTVKVSTGEIDQSEMSSVYANLPQASGAISTKPGTNKTKLLEGVKLLLVEDGPDNQRLISFVLRKAGADVTVAENGCVAVDTIQSAETGDFDVILMDMQMPELDGYGATKLLRERGYAVPIVALTAHAMAGDRQKCMDAGCDDYATKPIDRNALIETIYAHAFNDVALNQPV